MDFTSIYKKNIEREIKPGVLLIAEPFLADPNFARTVVFICEHNDDGTVGFVLNNPTEYTIADLMPESDVQQLPVNIGGPVQENTLHMLHRIPGALGGREILDGIYWGGLYEALENNSTGDVYTESDVRLFVGYSGWSPGQLNDELKQGSWLIADGSLQLLFETSPDEVWKAAIASLGSEFQHLLNMPRDPQLN